MATEITIRKTVKGDYQIGDAHWANISPQAVDLTTRMLDTNPETRITILEALLHPFITDRKALKQFVGVNRAEEDLGDNILRPEDARLAL